MLVAETGRLSTFSPCRSVKGTLSFERNRSPFATVVKLKPSVTNSCKPGLPLSGADNSKIYLLNALIYCIIVT
ncbi:hypothetical protein [Klebsiella phage vB_KpnS_Uniso31]|uniref:Uncharacterized protein n=1 Tax=Klebsiella phage vB_KpnS_Uniso31 TaxID=2951200 RepID=A0A9E7SXQ9_9CAUD|nr:hypothetical protein [Klebsiella phage vB_KpnS_Uniso31]